MAAVEVRARDTRPSRWKRELLTPFLLLLPCFVWVATFFLAPIGLLLWWSLNANGFSVEPYTSLVSSRLFHRVLRTTIELSAITVAIALVAGYPLAYFLTSTSRRMRALVLVLVFIPYWVDLIVRSFSWLLVLGDNGIVNAMLMQLGIVDAPAHLIYNRVSVLLSMVQVVLPFMILMLYGSMTRIDRSLLAAAAIHGGNPWRSFWIVFFPLSLPGVTSASLLVFIYSIGFYVMPAMLGSPRETMITQAIVIEASELFDLPRASAMGIVLLAMTTIMAILYNRYFGLDRMLGGHGK